MTSRPRRRRGRIEPTDEWEQIELLCGCPKQRDYEIIRPLVLFGTSADNRSQETGTSRPQRRLFVLDALGEGGWLKAMKLHGYAPRAPRGARHLQQALFAYAEAL